MPRGEIVGIVGESGSGKSTLALAVMRLLSGNARITCGEILFGGSDLLKLSDRRHAGDLRGTRIAMVFQDPMTSLNPVRSIGQQMLDIQYRDTNVLARRQACKGGTMHFSASAFPMRSSQLDRYPFQFSGGMRQRIAIAMSLLQKPELLIADEITTALDVTLEAQILHLLRELRTEIDRLDPVHFTQSRRVAEICDRVVVLYAGEVVEQGPVVEIFDRPQHPYTRALIACDPARIETATRELPVIPGDVPNLLPFPMPASFAPRCSDCH